MCRRMRMRVFLLSIMASNATAAEFDAFKKALNSLQKNSDQVFLILMGCLIFFMQTGFAFLEAGSVRAKNTTNILIKNVLDVFLGAIAYWLFGYAFAFGSEGNAFISHGYFALASLPDNLFSHWFFHFVFAATAATIVSGAMSERTEFKAYLIYSFFITGIIYPVVSHWAWDPKGWLGVGISYSEGSNTVQISYQDFAGSGVVHVLGGTCALVGALIVGPRIDRFYNGKPVSTPGHTVPLSALGGFVLFFGFLAFNGGSQGSVSNPGDASIVAKAIVNTVISGASGALVALVFKRLGIAMMEKYWSLLITINGALTGMVAICASCNIVYSYGAMCIGVVSGFSYILWSTLILKAGIDDPIDAVAVHMGGGLWGVIATPLLNQETGILYNWDKKSFCLFGWSFVGAVAIIAWAAAMASLLFWTLRLTKQLRVPADIELKGLDIPKHGEPAYPMASYGHGWTEAEQDMRTTDACNDPRAHVSKSPNGALELLAVTQLQEQGGIDNIALNVSNTTE